MIKIDKRTTVAMKNSLGKCKNCPFLEIRDVGKVYCFYHIKPKKEEGFCLLNTMEGERNANSRKESRRTSTIRKKS